MGIIWYLCEQMSVVQLHRHSKSDYCLPFNLSDLNVDFIFCTWSKWSVTLLIMALSAYRVPLSVVTAFIAKLTYSVTDTTYQQQHMAVHEHKTHTHTYYFPCDCSPSLSLSVSTYSSITNKQYLQLFIGEHKCCLGFIFVVWASFLISNDNVLLSQ